MGHDKPRLNLILNKGLVKFDLTMGENMSVLFALGFLLVSTFILLFANYLIHRDDEFNEVKQWEKFKQSFDKW